MAAIDDIITKELILEGGGGVTNDPADPGGLTQYGISQVSNPIAWADGKVTEAEARAIYLSKYVLWPKFNLVSAPLQAQLVDYGINSGPQLAIMKLQAILGVAVDGIIGPETLKSIADHDINWLNNRLVSERVKMIGRIVQKNPVQLKYLSGWLNRALEWII